MKLAVPVIRPTNRDYEPQLFGRSLSPDTVGALLDAGARGDLAAQSDLFNLMEDTWPRLRANLQKDQTRDRLNLLPLDQLNALVGLLVGIATLIYLCLRIRDQLRDRNSKPSSD